MTSLPQGWHSAMPQKLSNGNVSDIPRIIPRKKWNSTNISEMKNVIPFKKKSIHNGVQSDNNITAAHKQSVFLNSTCQPAVCTPKVSSQLKDVQLELNRVKQEFAVIKTENGILKTRVRKLDDENKQKLKQIEKLQTQIKNDRLDMSNRLSKESESQVALRQKCSKLEKSSREKDQIIKKLTLEIKAASVTNKSTNSKEIIARLTLKPAIINTEEKNAVLKQSRITNVRNHAPNKQEAEKLRNLVHKLEQESRNLGAQVKEKDIEIRRLKLHVQRTVNLTVNQSQSNLRKSAVRTTEGKPALGNRQSTSHEQKTNVMKPDLISGIPSSSTFVVKKARVVTKPRQSRYGTRTIKVHSNAASLNNEELQLIKAQNLREDIAARKIQRGWQKHRKMMQEDLPEVESNALTLLANEIQTHKENGGKLKNFLCNNDELENEEIQIIRDRVNSVFGEMCQESIVLN